MRGIASALPSFQAMSARMSINMFPGGVEMKKALIALCVIVLLAGCVTVGGWQWLAVASTRRLSVGMTKADVQAIMPYPSKINRTQTQAGMQEQIIWRGVSAGGATSPTIYLYFENDVLVGWQEG